MIQVINSEDTATFTKETKLTLASLLGIEVRTFCLWAHDGTRLRKYWWLTYIEIC